MEAAPINPSDFLLVRGIYGVRECLHERDRLRLHAERIGIEDAARQQQRVEALRQGLVEVHIDRELVTPIGEVPAADSFVLRRHDAGVRAGLGLPGFDQLDLLEAIRDEDGDLQSFEILISLAMFLLPYAAFLKLPWGSMTNFLAAPLSKSL